MFSLAVSIEYAGCFAGLESTVRNTMSRLSPS